MLSLVALAVLTSAVAASPVAVHQNSERDVAPKYSGDLPFTYVGCYADSLSDRTLINLVRTNRWTQAECLTAVRDRRFSYGGLEYGGECWGADILPDNATPLSADRCSMTCNDDRSTSCGGNLALDVYAFKIGRKALDTAEYSYKGCFADSNDLRVLPNLYNQGVAGSWTIESCLAANSAAGNKYAGLEFGGEWGGKTTLTSGKPQLPASRCAYTCNDAQDESCGGLNSIDLYIKKATSPVQPLRDA